jgi:hypothetical protein
LDLHAIWQELFTEPPRRPSSPWLTGSYHPRFVQSTNAISGEGLHEGLDWLARIVA